MSSGPHDIRRCERDGCPNPARNTEEHYCPRHESRETYEKYEKKYQP